MKKEKKIRYSTLSKLYILIWLLLILILWNIWLHIRWWCSWWFFIDLCLDLIIDYYWTSAWYISVFFFIIWIYLLIKWRKIKKEKQKQKNAKLMLSTWILSIVIFYIFSPNSYYFTPNFLQNRNWDLSFSIDKYIKNIEKYCFSYYDHWLPPKYEWGICEWKWKLDFINSFSIENKINTFKYSKNTNNLRLYYWNSFKMKKKNRLKMLKLYIDRDIYIYTIMRFREDIKFLREIEKLTKDKVVLDFLQSVYKNEPLKEKILNMPWINQKIFEIFWL